MQDKDKIRSISLVALVGKVQLLICLGISIFLILLSKVILEKKPLPFDVYLLESLHKINEPVLSFVLHPFYAVGDTQFAAAIVVISLAVLCWKRYWQEAKVLAIASLGILLIVDKLLKPFFLRRRPPDRLDHSAAGFSFPSGHATGNLVLYFYLSYILAAHYPKLTVYIYGLTTTFLIIMGLSSVYLRVHWPTDILAGYGFGYIWLTICLVMLKLSSNKYK